MKDIMIDLETLGVRPSAAIIQIGACYFDRDTGEIGDQFCWNVHHDTDDFTKDYGTISWWMKQSEAARCALLGTR